RRETAGGNEKMTKSKKNVVGLDAIVDTYGADTARLYLLSDSPPERDLEWTDTGIEGIWRYVNRLWRMVSEPAVELPIAGDAAAGAVLREGLETITRLLGPMMPHLAEEMWQHLGHGDMLAEASWPD